MRKSVFVTLHCVMHKIYLVACNNKPNVNSESLNFVNFPNNSRVILEFVLSLFVFCAFYYFKCIIEIFTNN